MIALASASASRARLLREAGVMFEVVGSDFDEAAAKSEHRAAGAGPLELALKLAEGKAKAARVAPATLVVGADQTLDLDGESLDKAQDLSAARAQLRRLRGRDHLLHAAAVLTHSGEVVWRGVSSPRLRVRDFSNAFLEDYLERCEDLASVGCYQLEGRGAQLFDRIEGDYFAVLGLPLIELLGALREQGALPS